MDVKEGQRTQNALSTLIFFVIVFALLRFAKTVFIPLALSLMLSFLLTPLVARLRKFGFGRILSILSAVILSSSLIIVLTTFVSLQIIEVAKEIPKYRENIQKKLQKIAAPREGFFEKGSAMVRELTKELQPKEPVKANGEPADEKKPIAVEVHQRDAGPLEMLRRVAGSVLNPMLTLGMVLVFTMFMLFHKDDLRDRFLRLTGQGQMHITTEALDDAGQRVSRYLLMQLVVNVTYAIPVSIGLYFIGIPNPLLWGLLAMMLRFIPYAGPVVASSLPILLSFAVDPGWSKPVMTISLFVVLELISNNFMEPWLYGTCTGISPVAIMVTAVFWTWLWGPVGLFLSTPMTVCLAVIGRHVPRLHFLNVLLGDEPVLDPPSRFYQRMLALESTEASDIAEKYLEDHTHAELYDEMIVPALSLAEQDKIREAISEERVQFIVENTLELVEALSDYRPKLEKGEDKPHPRPPIDRTRAPVLCIPARHDLDRVAAEMLVDLLKKRGIGARSVPAATLASECMEAIESDKVQLVCISAVPPSALTHARYLCKRLRTQFPELKIIVGLWAVGSDLEDLQRRLSTVSPNAIVTTLAQAEAQAVALAEAKAKPQEVRPAPTVQPEEAPGSLGVA